MAFPPKCAYGDLLTSEITVKTYGKVQASAILSPCRKYRYRLTRTWDAAKPSVLFVCLNPSTADHTTQDNTARRCMDFARTWDYGGMMIANLYAFRSTDPLALRRMPMQEALGEFADAAIVDAVTVTALTVCAWTDHGQYGGRGHAVARMLANRGQVLHVFELNQTGQPKHPLYVPAAARLMPWAPKFTSQPETLVHLSKQAE